MVTFNAILGRQTLGTIIPGHVDKTHIASGGIQTSGKPLITRTQTVLWYDPLRGITVNSQSIFYQRGRANATFANSVNRAIPDIYKEIQLGGSYSLKSLTYKHVSTGGINLLNSANVKYSRKIKTVASGGVTISGNSINKFKYTFRHVASGSATISYTTPIRRGFSYVVVSGITLTGTATAIKTIDTHPYIGSGGIAISGKSICLSKLRYTAISNIQLSAIKSYLPGRKHISSGGVLIQSNTNSKITNRKYISISKILISSSALVVVKFRKYNVISTGGLNVSGYHDVIRNFNYRKCGSKISCLVELPEGTEYRDCFDLSYFLPEEKHVLSYPLATGAFLPAVTVCRQKYIVPTTINKRTKIWSTK